MYFYAYSLCYINDFWLATSLFTVLFADDTTGLGKGKNLKDLTAYVNLELQKISNWFRANKMAVNAAKTKFIVFMKLANLRTLL